MNKPNHSPLPFKRILNAGMARGNIYDAEGNLIGRFHRDDGLAKEHDELNAEFIVRACNNYYPLLEALKVAKKLLRELNHTSIQVNQAIDKAEQS